MCVRMNARLIINGMKEATITKIGITTCTIRKGTAGLAYEIDNRSVESCTPLGEPRAKDFDVVGFDQRIHMREDHIVIGCTTVSEHAAQKLFEEFGAWLGYDVEK